MLNICKQYIHIYILEFQKNFNHNYRFVSVSFLELKSFQRNINISNWTSCEFQKIQLLKFQ